MLELDESADGRAYTVRIGTRVLVRLSENPSTGFRWKFGQDGAVHCRVAIDTFDAAGGAIGRGGTHNWQLDAVAAGAVLLRFSLGRSWEQQAPARVVTIQLTIGD